MNNNDINTKIEVIKTTFSDPRKISPMSDKHEFDGQLFKTDSGEIIYLDIQLRDFDEEELAKCAEIAEELYDKYQNAVSVYILCPDNINICVKECEIISKADFTIKLACIQENPAHIVLDAIKEKIKNNEPLDGDDLHALSMTPVMCKKEDREYFRKEYFKIMNKL